MARLIAREVKKVFAPTRAGQEPVVALRNISFQAEGHTFVTLVGPSGCGKTTFLNMVSGIERPSGGTLQVIGRNEGEARHRLRLPGPPSPALEDSSAEHGIRARRRVERRAERAREAFPVAGQSRGQRRHVSRPAFGWDAAAGRVSPGRYPSSRTCCSWTSRSAISTPSRHAICGRAAAIVARHQVHRPLRHPRRHGGGPAVEPGHHDEQPRRRVPRPDHRPSFPPAPDRPPWRSCRQRSSSSSRRWNHR